MTTLETILAAAVAILGAWLLWPCALIGVFQVAAALVAAALLAIEMWEAWERRKPPRRK